MTWRDALDTALDTPHDDGPTEVVGPSGTRAEIDVVAAGPVGVKARAIRLRRAEDRDVGAEAERLRRDLRSLGSPIEAAEVAPALGGARLRTARDAEGFDEIVVDGPREVEVRRWTVDADGQRAEGELELTRRDLGRLLGELDG